MTEQTACADDAMVAEERREAPRRQRPAGVPVGGGVPARGPDGEGTGAAAGGKGDDTRRGGLGETGRAATLQHLSQQRLISFNVEHTLVHERACPVSSKARGLAF